MARPDGGVDDGYSAGMAILVCVIHLPKCCTEWRLTLGCHRHPCDLLTTQRLLCEAPGLLVCYRLRYIVD